MYKALKSFPNNIERFVALLTILAFLLSIFAVIILHFHPFAQAQEGWLTGWQYRKSHVINPASGAGTNYQARVEVHYGNGTDGGEKVYLNGGRYTLAYHKITIDSTVHNNYGLEYPATFVFSIPEDSSNLKAYKRYLKEQSWIQLETKTSDDFFNGIECVRFDYTNNKAYVSVAFSAESDEIHIKITNANDQTVQTSFIGIAEYYDNRKAVVVATADDLDGDTNEAFMAACDVFQSKQVWLTVGIITQGFGGSGPPNWTAIQGQLDEGYIEVASHSRTHPQVPYSDYDSEIGGSKNDIITNLTLNSLYRKGNNQYVWTWIEPYGQSDSTVRQKLSQYKYLDDRATEDYPVNGNQFVGWDYTNGLFERCGVSIWADEKTVNELNSEFDGRYDAGEIYHFYFHPGWHDWSGSNVITQHLDYIKGKKDVWYVGLGALYAYHFVAENIRDIIQVERVYSFEKCSPDFGDVRFTASDGVTLLDYWMQEKVDGDHAVFWVKISDNLSSNPATIYVYYGKSEATSTSNGNNTFLFFDDFSGSTVDTNKWYINGAPFVEHGILTLKTNPDLDAVRSKVSFTQGSFRMHSRFRLVEEEGIMLGLSDNDFVWDNGDGGVAVGNLRTYFTIDKYGSSNWVSSSLQTDYSYHVFELIPYSTTVMRMWIDGGYQTDSLSGNAQSNYYVILRTWRDGVGEFDWVFVRKYVSPEPSHGSWGSEETFEEENNAPTIGEFQAPNIVYANKYFLLNATINDPDGTSDFANATIEIPNGVTLKWTGSTDTFSKQSDLYGYCILDSAGSFKTQLNSTAYKLSWKIKLGWSYPESFISVISTNTKVFDGKGASSSASYTNLFYFEDDLIVYSASVDDSRINPSQSITFTGTLYYQGTTTPPEDTSGITAKVELNGALKGSTTTIGANGTFSISLAGESNVAQYSYVVFASTDENTVQNQTVNVIIDRVKITSLTVADGRIDVGSAGEVRVQAVLEYDNHPLGSGDSISVNGTAVSWDAVNGWFDVHYVFYSVGRHVFNVTSASESTYGITALYNPLSLPEIIWDRIKITDGGATKESLALGENTTIWFKATYEYENTAFTSANGTLYLNGSPMTWSSTNTRWEYTYTATATGTATFTISAVYDSSQGLTTITDTVGTQTITVWSIPFAIISNSTITELTFNSTSKTLTFTVSGPTGTKGYINLTISKTLIEDISGLTIYLDENPIDYTTASTDYFWLIHFTYNHSTHKVVIILNSPNSAQFNKEPLGTPTTLSVISLAILATTLLVWIRRTRRQHQN
jgi:hypothetical protein